MTLNATPFIKWPGGKRSLLPILLGYVPIEIETYYEPFVGGGALFFHLANEQRFRDAVLNDFNQRLVWTYEVVQQHPSQLIAYLKEFAHKHKQDQSDFYYSTREIAFKDETNLTLLAAQFIYLNKAGFNGLYRVNQKNEFNVPFGRYTNPAICDPENLMNCSRALFRAKLQSGDFTHSLGRIKKGDFLYCDSPYMSRTGKEFTKYTSNDFTYADQKRLSIVARRLKDKGISILLSNADTEEVRELYEGFEFIEVPGKRSVGATEERRGYVEDLLIR